MKKWLVVHFKWAFFSGWSRHVDCHVHMAWLVVQCLAPDSLTLTVMQWLPQRSGDQHAEHWNIHIYIYIYIWRWRTVINATGHLWAQRQAQTDVCFCLTLSCVHDDNVKQHWDFFFLFCLFGFLPVITHEEHVGHSEGDLEPTPVCDKVGEQRKDEETHTEEHLVQDTHCSPVLHTNNLCD